MLHMSPLYGYSPPNSPLVNLVISKPPASQVPHTAAPVIHDFKGGENMFYDTINELPSTSGAGALVRPVTPTTSSRKVVGFTRTIYNSNNDQVSNTGVSILS